METHQNVTGAQELMISNSRSTVP